MTRLTTEQDITHMGGFACMICPDQPSGKPTLHRDTLGSRSHRLLTNLIHANLLGSRWELLTAAQHRMVVEATERKAGAGWVKDWVRERDARSPSQKADDLMVELTTLLPSNSDTEW